MGSLFLFCLVFTFYPKPNLTMKLLIVVASMAMAVAALPHFKGAHHGSHDEDPVNQMVMDMLYEEWQGPDNCIDKCKESAKVCGTLNKIKNVTSCIVECSPMTACYTAEGIAAEDVVNMMSGMVRALKVDGCELSEALGCCEMPSEEDMALLIPEDKTDCNPPKPELDDAKKAMFCEHFRCVKTNIWNDESCVRAIPSTLFNQHWLMEWLEC